MTFQELQDKISKEKANQQRQQQAEHDDKMRKQNILRNKLYAYLPKVNEWLKMLNEINRSGIKLFSYSESMYSWGRVPQNSWQMVTDGIMHKFGLYGVKAYYSTEGITFTKMGCEGGGCSGEDVWTDGIEWYIGSSRPIIVRNNIVNECRIKSTLRAIEEFETYFNECLESLGK